MDCLNCQCVSGAQSGPQKSQKEKLGQQEVLANKDSHVELARLPALFRCGVLSKGATILVPKPIPGRIKSIQNRIAIQPYIILEHCARAEAE